jgi:DNA-binding FadR family transcriptional regulator
MGRSTINAEVGTVSTGDELQRISACMLGAYDPANLAHEAVFGMEQGLLRRGWPVGQSLGALPEVRKRLGLGRPAFREAITILEARGLLDIRRGPGGGVFVAAPLLEDAVGAILMHLALIGETHACIQEFRRIVWRMIVSIAIEQNLSGRADPAPMLKSGGSGGSAWGFAVDLADRSGNATVALLARLTELLVRTSDGQRSPECDLRLDEAIERGDAEAALARLDTITGPVTHDWPVIAFELAERTFSLSGRKSAMALAARMTRELSLHGTTQEAEWETAERLGYTDAVVRQARRILQDFGIVQCRQGRKGAELAPRSGPTGVIRLLAPCLMAGAGSMQNNREAISFLVSGAPALAAARRKAGRAPTPTCSTDTLEYEAIEAVTLENLLLEMSGNPLLAIVVRSLGMASVFVAADPMPPADRHTVVAMNRRILRAIDAGDETTANSLAQIKLKTMQKPPEILREVA